MKKAEIRRLTPDDVARELKLFEQKYGMTSADFVTRYEQGEMGDAHEIMVWRGLCRMAAVAPAAKTSR
jgi:hypothetical protein